VQANQLIYYRGGKSRRQWTLLLPRLGYRRLRPRLGYRRLKPLLLLLLRLDYQLRLLHSLRLTVVQPPPQILLHPPRRLLRLLRPWHLRLLRPWHLRLLRPWHLRLQLRKV
jgi:hypothetical protein